MKSFDDYGFNMLTETCNSNSDDSGDDFPQLDNPKIKDETKLTDNAKIYQSILKYSINFGTEKYFKNVQILKDHLLANCPVFKNKFTGNKAKTNLRNREKLNGDIIDKALEKLEYLELVESKSTRETGTKESEKEYKFTKIGRLLGLIISNNETKQEFYNIFIQLVEIYDSMNHVYARFCSIFFRCCFKYEKFDNIIYFISNSLKDATDDKDGFIYQIKNLPTFYRNFEMWDIFKLTLNALSKLSHYEYEIFLFHLKLTIEEVHEWKCKNLKDFEKMRLEQKHEYDSVVLEAYCNTCTIEYRYTPILLKTMYYLESCLESDISRRIVSKLKCTRCNEEYYNFQIIT